MTMRFDANSAAVPCVEKKTDPLHNSLAHTTLMVTRRGRILSDALSFPGKMNPVNHMLGGRSVTNDRPRIS